MAAENLVRTAIEQFGRLDVLVNVAGILRDRMVFNMTEQEWDDVIRVHMKGTFNTTRFASARWRSLREESAQNRRPVPRPPALTAARQLCSSLPPALFDMRVTLYRKE